LRFWNEATVLVNLRSGMDVNPAPASRAAETHADVLLVTGLHEELRWAQQIFGVTLERHTEQGTTYLRGEFRRGNRSISLVTLRQLDKGLTTAAVTATKAICTWQPNVVLMTGICAGISGAVDLGDLIVATQCFEHSAGQRIEGEIVPSQNRVAIKPWLLDFVMDLTDNQDLPSRIRAGYTNSMPGDSPTRIHFGSMACGPYVVKDHTYMQTLKSREYSLVGLDMESYGVALATEMCCSPAHSVFPLIIKGVCDFADANKADNWHDYCAYASAALAGALLEEAIQRDTAYSVIKGTRSD
jgi:nucleoside phosphorylase